MTHSGDDFTYRFLEADMPATDGKSTTLLLLHGTGGDENDLIPLGRMLMPHSAILSPRGKVLEGTAPRFFRRLAEGVLDQEDLAVRTDELAAFIETSIEIHKLDRTNIVAVGFSNGANIAISLLLRHPGLLGGAVLLSPMLPFVPDVIPDLAGTSIFVGAGRQDPLVTQEDSDRLVAILEQSGASVTSYREEFGHSITAGEVSAAQAWILRLPSR